MPEFYMNSTKYTIQEKSAKRAVIYARYSSERQTEQSIEGQLRECHKYAEQNNFVIVKEYIDRAKTATNDRRHNFQRMLADSFDHNFDFVIVYALDRFARDDGDHGTDKKILQRNGVLLLSATQVIGVNPDGTENLGGILTEGIYVALAKYYSRELAQKVKRGQYESIQKKQFLGGFVPYGYRVVDKKLVVHKGESEIVRFIFEMYAKGHSAFAISNALKEKGLTNSIGEPFKPNGIMKMLKSIRYLGWYKYGGEVIKDYHTPIVEESLFYAVQDKIEQNKRNPARAKAREEYILSGKLYCGKCKTLMVGESGVGRTGEIYQYYACGKKKKSHSCDKKNIRKQELEDLVIKSTLSHILQPAIIENIADQLIKLRKKERKTDELALLNEQLTEVNLAIKNIMTAIKKGIITDSTKEELESLENEKNNLLKLISQQEFHRSVELTKDRIEFFFSQFKDFNINDYGARQYLVTYFIYKIIAYDDKIIIVYNHKDDNRDEISIEEIENSLIESGCFGFDTPPSTKGTISETKRVVTDKLVALIVKI